MLTLAGKEKLVLKHLDSLLDMEFEPNSADLCLFVPTRNGKKAYIITYVVNFLVGCEREEGINRVYTELHQHLEVTCLGNLKLFLGLEIHNNGDIFRFSLTQNIENSMSRLGLNDSNRKL